MLLLFFPESPSVFCLVTVLWVSNYRAYILTICLSKRGPQAEFERLRARHCRLSFPQLECPYFCLRAWFGSDQILSKALQELLCWPYLLQVPAWWRESCFIPDVSLSSLCLLFCGYFCFYWFLLLVFFFSILEPSQHGEESDGVTVSFPRSLAHPSPFYFSSR